MNSRDLKKILAKVEKPARYIGKEWGMIKKKTKNKVRFAFCFPDTYEIGMSHLGIKILYDILNKINNCSCERVFMPWIDFIKEIEGKHSLYALESYDPLYEFDIIGFTLQYELSYTNVLKILELGNVPIFSKERKDLKNLVIAGGPCVCNPEPMCDFIDVFLLGEGEYQIEEFVDLYNKAKKEKWSKNGFLLKATSIEGVYVPKFYSVTYNVDKTINRIEPNKKIIDEIELTEQINNVEIKGKVKKAVVKNFDEVPFPKTMIVPYVEVVHDRVTIEVMRGCIRGCRFCQAGFIYRPKREKSSKTLVKQTKRLLNQSGYNEVSLCSLSTSDYSELDEYLNQISNYTENNKVNISLPSLRIDNLKKETVEKIKKVRQSSLTFAPEAGSQRLRDVINKNITENDILNTCEMAFKEGYSTVKLYFMIGLPTETLEDIKDIQILANKIKEQYYSDKSRRKRLKITISAATFVPKPFTPFQWEAQDAQEDIKLKQNYLVNSINSNKIKVNYHNMDTSRLEGVLARGDRNLSKVIYTAYKKGCYLDSWDELYRFDKWEESFEENKTTIDFYATRKRTYDEVLPWSHLDYYISEDFLKRENKKAHETITTKNCKESCSGCGANVILGGKCFE